MAKTLSAWRHPLSPCITLGHTHRPPLWYNGGGGGGLMDPPLYNVVFDMLQCLKRILPSMESLWSSLHNEVYFVGGGTAGFLWHLKTRLSSWPPDWVLSRIRNQVKKIEKYFFALNPFAPEPPVTARADPGPFYPLWRHQF